MDTPSSLELFLLCLLRRQRKTAFQVHDETGMSVGSCLPALKRLAERGWLAAAKPGARRQVAYALTGEGKEVIKGWRAILDAYLSGQPDDPESVVRLAAVAWLHGDRARAKKILESTGEALDTAAKKVPPHSPASKYDLSGFYRSAMTKLAASRRRGDARALRELRDTLPPLS